MGVLVQRCRPSIAQNQWPEDLLCLVSGVQLFPLVHQASTTPVAQSPGPRVGPLPWAPFPLPITGSSLPKPGSPEALLQPPDLAPRAWL